LNEKDGEKTESDEPRKQVEKVQHLVVEKVQQSEEQVQVEEITNQHNTKIEQEQDNEEDNQVEITGPLTRKKKTREKPAALKTPRMQKEITLSLM
jgi:hypothetical protein